MAARLGLGLAALGRPAYITAGRERDLGPDRSEDALREHAWQVIDAAWELGIRYLDAARSYGLAERFLGGWLRQRATREGVTIGSKWGYRYVGGWRMDADVHEVKDHSLDSFEAQWPETLAELGKAPDVYLIHSVTPDSPALGDRRLLDRLAGLAETGVRVGISTSGPRQGEVLEAALADRDSPFSAVQATWNLLEPSASTALRAAHGAGWLVVVKEVFANGRLGPDGDIEPLTRIAAERGTTPDRLALGAALGQDWADIVLSGAVTPSQLRENSATPPTGLDPELDSLALEAGKYWSERSSRAWT